MASMTIKRGDTWPPLRGLAAETALVVTSGTSTSDTLLLPGHGFSAGDQVMFTELSGASPLVAGNLYYVSTPTLNTFKVASSSGGTALDLTSDFVSGTMRRLLPLASATGAITVFLKSQTRLISGVVTVINPPIEDGGQLFNWKYIWAAADTGTAGDYEAELEIIWDPTTTPPHKESVPNGPGPTVSIIADLG